MGARDNVITSHRIKMTMTAGEAIGSEPKETIPLRTKLRLLENSTVSIMYLTQYIFHEYLSYFVNTI